MSRAIRGFCVAWVGWETNREKRETNAAANTKRSRTTVDGRGISFVVRGLRGTAPKRGGAPRFRFVFEGSLPAFGLSPSQAADAVGSAGCG